MGYCVLDHREVSYRGTLHVIAMVLGGEHTVKLEYAESGLEPMEMPCGTPPVVLKLGASV